MSLRANKLRTFLTLLGVIVGVTSVIAVITIISGLDKTVATAFSSQGSTVFSVSKRPLVITSREDFIKFNNEKTLQRTTPRLLRECAAVRPDWHGGKWLGPWSSLRKINPRNVSVRGLTPVMFDIENTTIQAGHRWTEQEGVGDAMFALSAPIYSKIFFNGRSAASAVGEVIRVDGIPYQVIGVADPFRESSRIFA